MDADEANVKKRFFFYGQSKTTMTERSCDISAQELDFYVEICPYSAYTSGRYLFF